MSTILEQIAGSLLSFEGKPTRSNAWVAAQEHGEINELKELHKFLQAAIEVEHMTIPLYLTALYTIKPGTNRESYEVIRSIVMEEMLHMTLAANILNAVGGDPRTTYPNFVGYPACVPCRQPPLWAPLRHFSEKAIDLFLTIESTGENEEFKNYIECPPEGEFAGKWHSIGEFYEIIRTALCKLVKTQGEKKVFTGPPGRQIGPEYFYNSGGEVIKVNDLDSAMLAMEIIVDQGEGLHHGIFTSDDRLFGEQRQVAHYFRFNEIRKQRHYGPYDTPGSGPNGEPLEVDWKAVYRIKVPDKPNEKVHPPSDSEVCKHLDRFNTEYAKLLVQLEWSFRGHPGMIIKAIPTMWDLRYLAEEIFRNPHDRYPDCKANPTFEITKKDLDTAAEELKSNSSTVSQDKK